MEIAKPGAVLCQKVGAVVSQLVPNLKESVPPPPPPGGAVRLRGRQTEGLLALGTISLGDCQHGGLSVGGAMRLRGRQHGGC